MISIKDGVIVYEEGITVGQLAEKVGQTPANVIKVLFLLGTMVTINSSLTDEQATTADFLIVSNNVVLP